MAELYGYGTKCTWHGPLTFAEPSNGEDDEAGYVCPKCGIAVKTDLSAELFWARVVAVDRRHPGYEPMMRWAEGKCFPDFDSMQGAYRQHMEGEL